MTEIRIKDATTGVDMPTMDKEEAHKRMQGEFLSKGTSAIQDCHSKGIILDPDGYMTLQKKPLDARDNCGLIDTSWGAHIAAGDTRVTSAMYECARELRVPMTVFGDSDFYQMIENHPDITSELAVSREVAYKRKYSSTRVLQDGMKWVEPCELTFYILYFDGKLKRLKSDGAGDVYHNIDGLRGAIERSPGDFTPDLIDIVKEYGHLLVPYNELEDVYLNSDPRTNELIQEYDLQGNPKGTRNRSGLHDGLIEQFHSGGQQATKHPHVRVVLRHTNGAFYLAQRSMFKMENPGLRDKPIAGHVGLSDSYDTAVIHECNDELSIPAAVLRERDFRALVRYRPDILKDQAVLMSVAELENYVSSNRVLRDQEPWDEICDTAVYYGVYDGPIRFKDGESTGAEVMSLEELKTQLNEHPELYTHDLIDLIKLIEERGLV